MKSRYLGFVLVIVIGIISFPTFLVIYKSGKNKLLKTSSNELKKNIELIQKKQSELRELEEQKTESEEIEQIINSKETNTTGSLIFEPSKKVFNEDKETS